MLVSKYYTIQYTSNLVLNFEKCHFIKSRNIALGHVVFLNGIEVDPTKIDVIAKLSYPINVREVHSFLGHVKFYRRFIKDFCKIAQSMTPFIKKNVDFVFDEKCKSNFDLLKNALSSTPIIHTFSFVDNSFMPSTQNEGSMF